MEDLNERIEKVMGMLVDVRDYSITMSHRHHACEAQLLIRDLQATLSVKDNVIADAKRTNERLKETLERMKKSRGFWFDNFKAMTEKRDKAHTEALRLSDEVESLKGRLGEATDARLQRSQENAELRDALARAEHRIETMKNEKAAIVAELEQTREDLEDAQWGRVLANAAAERLKQELDAVELVKQYRAKYKDIAALWEAADRAGELERCVDEAIENVRKEQHAHAETKQQLAEAKTRAAQWTRCYYTEVKVCVETKQQLAEAERRAVKWRDTFNAEFTAHAETKRKLAETRQQLTDAQFQTQMASEAWRALARKVS